LRETLVVNWIDLFSAQGSQLLLVRRVEAGLRIRDTLTSS
jgi:hypothetical protein